MAEIDPRRDDEHWGDSFGRNMARITQDHASRFMDEEERARLILFEERQNDLVNHPAHYTAGGVECIDALEAATVGLMGIEAVCTANVIKYLWRWKRKGGKQDLEKAKWYLERLIDKVGA